MKLGLPLATLTLVLVVACSGCAQRGNAVVVSTDQWLGQWNGPEGTFLRVDGGGGRYQITIRNLDGPQTYPGVADGSQIKFDRQGIQESLHATNGAQTGMKWLVDKEHCLTVRSGEGYCRD